MPDDQKAEATEGQVPVTFVFREGDESVIDTLQDAMDTLRKNKPNDRSEKDRRYAVTLTEMEKVYAYFVQWVPE